MKFNFHNPFRKSLTPSQQMIREMKTAALGNIQNQMADLIIGIFSGATAYNDKKKYKIIMRGKAVEELHADPKDEEADQDAIYSNFMAMMNGDRDIAYDVPSEIEINAFDNDSLTDEQRNEIYDIIDTINEANDINRDGIFRTEESVKKEEEESRRKAESSNTNLHDTNNIKDAINDIIRPIVNLVTAMFTSIITLIVMSKFASIIDRI